MKLNQRYIKSFSPMRRLRKLQSDLKGNSSGSIGIECPLCKCMQEVPAHAQTVFCTKCNNLIKVKQLINFNILLFRDTQEQKEETSKTKSITCSACDLTYEVPSVALSTFCRNCGYRINLQDYKIQNSFHGDLETQGTILITPSGTVSGQISAGNVIVHGTVTGTISADKTLLGATAKIYGNIESPNMSMNPGAIFIGKSNIGPYRKGKSARQKKKR